MTDHNSYSIWPQVYASLSVSIGGLCTGTFFAFSSVSIPLLIQVPEEGGWGISLKQGSWIVSLFFLGAILGTGSSGLLIGRFGSKRVCNVVAPVILASWAITGLAVNLPMILVGRIMSGLCYGLLLSVVKVYNAEVSHPEVRGLTSAFYPVLIPAGTIYCYILGYVLDNWRVIAVLCSIPAVIYFVMSLFIPESPFWLMEHGRESEARAALQWLRGTSSDVTTEFNAIRSKKLTRGTEGSSLMSKLKSKAFLRPLFMVGFLVVLVEAAGMKIMQQYMVVIFEQSGSSIDPTLAPVIVATVQTGIGCCGGMLLRCSPRRPLFLLCCFIIILSHTSLATYSHYHALNPSYVQATYGWIPLAALISTISAEGMGMLTIINFNLQAESFSTEHRAVGCALLGITAQGMRFLMGLLFPPLLSSLGFSGAFYLFACVITAVTVYGFIIIPENKGQSLVKTEDKFDSKKPEEEIEMFNNKTA